MEGGNWRCLPGLNAGVSALLLSDEMAAILDLPGKLDVSGDHVLGLYEAGDQARIDAYCQHDALTTAAIYAKMARQRRWWDQEKLANFQSSVTQFLQQNQGTHWDDWAEYWPALRDRRLSAPGQTSPAPSLAVKA